MMNMITRNLIIVYIYIRINICIYVRIYKYMCINTITALFDWSMARLI